MATFWEVLDPILAESTEGLFADFGLTLKFEEGKMVGPFGPEEKVAIVGFAEEAIRGSLVLSADNELLDKSCPAPPPPRSADDLGDWAAELTNQLLGRIKRALLSYGVALQVGTPTVIFGRDMHVVSRRDASCATRVFVCGGKSVQVSFQAEVRADLALHRLPLRPQDSNLLEGTLLLF
jgi:chemotaxis protein CheX